MPDVAGFATVDPDLPTLARASARGMTFPSEDHAVPVVPQPVEGGRGEQPVRREGLIPRDDGGQVKGQLAVVAIVRLATSSPSNRMIGYWSLGIVQACINLGIWLRTKRVKGQRSPIHPLVAAGLGVVQGGLSAGRAALFELRPVGAN